ncbi:hypothetical protein [Paraburkholderia sp. RL17-373-BIF-A]|uniref:hypothetical protein n=1 Tax=Paraburkholderia sp. RL17-373-BIF-A TaxID=3031629 RepID=UPI0038B8DF2D
MTQNSPKKVDIPAPEDASFVDLVQRGAVGAPVHKSYSPDDWKAFHQSHRRDSDCDRLFFAGINIFHILSQLRNLYDEIPWPKDLSLHIRSLVALGNREARVLGAMTRESLAIGTKDGGLNELAQFRVTVSGGSQHSIEEVSQMVVDSLSKAVSERLQEPMSTKGRLDFDALGICGLEINICGTYRLVESLWQDCLWNGYGLVHGSNGETVAAPIGEQSASDVAWRVISEYRREMLQLSRATFLYQEFDKLDDNEKIARIPYCLVVHSDLSDPTTGFCFAHADDKRALNTAKQAFFALSGLRPEYYEDLLDQPQAKLGRGTLRELAVAWLAVRSISVAESMCSLETIVESVSDLSDFAKTYSQAELIDALGIALSTNAAKAEIFVDFLTFRGRPKQTLWTHPLVKLPSGQFCILALATEHASSTYVLERWMAYLGMNVSKKGNPFENQVRKRLATTRRSDVLKDQLWVLPSQFKFNPGVSGSRTEEIDLVMVLGTTVLLGEVKCSITPTESVDFFNNRQIINGAAEQISRKAAAVRLNPKAFVKALGKRGRCISENFKIVTLVLVNNPIFVGRDINGIPVTDLLVLERYIEGFLIERARMGEDGTLTSEHSLSFYSDLKEAEETVTRYLLNPPQLRHLVSGIKPRLATIPVDRFIDGPELSYETFETLIDTAAVLALQDKEAEAGTVF